MQDSGSLYFGSGKLRYRIGEQQIWQFSIEDLAVIGEYTTESFADDYFLVFIIGGGTVFEASFYAEGRDAAMDALSQALGANLECLLCNSMQFLSRVMWPEQLEMQPLMVERPRSMKDATRRIRRWIGLPDSDFYVSADVLEYASNANSRAAT